MFIAHMVIGACIDELVVCNTFALHSRIGEEELCDFDTNLCYPNNTDAHMTLSMMSHITLLHSWSGASEN